MRNIKHLSHLKNSIPKDVTGGEASFYPIQLEAWRRGLEVKFYNSRRGARVQSLAISYSLSDGENEYFFNSASGSKTTKEATKTATSKKLTNKLLKEHGVPVPRSETFNFDDSSIDELCKLGEEIGYPLVVKPTNMASGKGVVTNIASKEVLKNSLLNIKNELKREEVIIEKYFENGVDHRFYVIEDEVIAVTKNYSSNVIGNGHKNLRQLIKIRNRELRELYSTNSRKIKIDNEMLTFLNTNNMTLDYVPPKNERVFLRKQGTYLGSRLNAACTETVHPQFKQYAVQALKAIPGLPTGSVDMIINEETNEGVVNEVNSRGEIMTHLFPLEGQAIDIPKYLIDYYFPNSKKINDNFYFEYKPVKDLFLSGYANEITLPIYPKEKQYCKKMIISGEGLTLFYLRRLKKKAASLHLKGFIKSISNSKVEIDIIGRKNKIEDFESYINEPVTRKSRVYDIKTYEIKEFNGVSSIGLELIDQAIKQDGTVEKNKITMDSKSSVDKDKYKKEIMEKDHLIEELSKEIFKMKKSSSWKVTKPLRGIKNRFSK